MKVRLFLEKKKEVNIENESYVKQFHEFLHIKNVKDIRIFSLYDIFFYDKIDENQAKEYVISSLTEKMSENYYFDNLPDDVKDCHIIAVALLPAQYDQKADSASSCIMLVSKLENIKVTTAKVYCIFGNLTFSEKEKIKNYLINPVDSYEINLNDNSNKDFANEFENEEVYNYPIINLSDESHLVDIKNSYNLNMSVDDLKFALDEYKKEKRLPNLVELKILDTYWSDHCRHTTFNTELKLKEKDLNKDDDPRLKTLKSFFELKTKINSKNLNFTLMELATIYAKYLKNSGKLTDVEDSEEINACSIEIKDNQGRDWLIEFKNETHNHPTEIEPFGGASTCIGGCIRDPLSSRAYVFGAMRVSGSADPRVPIEKTMAGKLPQRKITTFAAKGFSSYGNQIGLATGQVVEFYHENYVAKRLEAGAVIGAALKKDVIRKSPRPGNIVVLVGGKTGRDGIGGATGSSKDHDENSINLASSEVQKGNAVIERKLQRFLSNPDVTRYILKCNDFGAGGVAVAVGEIANGLKIYLDRVPLKYKGLKPDEIILSESQERMACVIEKENLEKFISLAEEEDLDVTYIADVIDDESVIFYYKDKVVAKIARSLLDSKGAKRFSSFSFKQNTGEKFENYIKKYRDLNLKDLLSQLNVSLQVGLNQIFDSTIGGFTVLLPYGGKYQLSPSQGMAFTLPDIWDDKNEKLNQEKVQKAVLMAMGFDPYLTESNPYLGAYYSIIESTSKIVTMGGDFSKIRYSLQEYFGKTINEEKWAIVVEAMLGALQAQMDLGLPAIGGKDSMSGTFKDIDVPPTLISFAVCVEDEDRIIPSCFMRQDSNIFLLYTPLDSNNLPDVDILKDNFEFFYYVANNKKIISANPIRSFGLYESLVKACFGNKIGFELNFDSFNDDEKIKIQNAFIGSIIFETYLSSKDLQDIYKQYIKTKEGKKDINLRLFLLGKTNSEKFIKLNDNTKYSIDELIEIAQKPLEDIFPTKTSNVDFDISKIEEKYINKAKDFNVRFSGKNINLNKKPLALILVFSGTNCEFDTKRAFERSDFETEIFIVRSKNKEVLNQSISELSKKINQSQVLCIPGGFSMGDEPDGSGKFIVSFLKREEIKNSVEKHLSNKNLILGICNGFQALLKSGLLPYGKIVDLGKNDPTLAQNLIGNHISRIVKVKVLPNKSPWHMLSNYDEIYQIPVSHGEGRFFASKEVCEKLFENYQVCSIYVDENGEIAKSFPDNPNGSIYAIESLVSLDGLVLGKMGHSERVVEKRIKNYPQLKAEPIFDSARRYFS